MTPIWPLIWGPIEFPYQNILLSKSHENPSKYVDTVTNCAYLDHFVIFYILKQFDNDAYFLACSVKIKIWYDTMLPFKQGALNT